MLNPALIAMVRAGAAYFALVFGAGFALGLIRVPFLVPRVGERIAELMEAPVMLIVIFFASRYIAQRFSLASSARLAVAVGVFALMLLVAAELLLVVALQGGDVAGYVAGRDPVSGSVYLASLFLYALMPWLQFRVRRSADPGVATSA